MKYLILSCMLASILLQPVYSQHDPVINEKIKKSIELRELKQEDPHRPIYHFLCPESYGQPFDPNGAIYWNGKYHLAYIYQKERNGKFEHVWGHAVSADLLHWSVYPDMVNIKDGDYENGIFSGGAFLSREGIPHIMYHGEGSSSNMVAYSTDPDLRTWTKFEKNPILKTPLEGDPMYGKYIAWDPEGWYDKETDTYYQISGGNPATFFKSKDMVNWEFLGEFIDPAQRRSLPFEDVSCPDFFKIGNKYMLLFIGHYMGTQYYIGDFKNEKFEVEEYGRMNWPGGTFFAPEQLVDDKGRNIIWGWIIERKPSHLKDFGWSGIMSLPRVLTLSKDNELQIHPAKELSQLRINEKQEPNIKLSGKTEKKLESKGKSLEIEIEVKGGQKTPYGLKVFCSPDGKEETLIKYDPVAEVLIIDFKKSSVNAPVEFVKYCIKHYLPTDDKDVDGTVSEQHAPFKLKKGESLKLNVFIDRSVIEVFANGRHCVTQVVYPELEASSGLVLFTEGDTVEAKNIKVWEMSQTTPF